MPALASAMSIPGKHLSGKAETHQTGRQNGRQRQVTYVQVSPHFYTSLFMDSTAFFPSLIISKKPLPR
jgi:hypothetical protein